MFLDTSSHVTCNAQPTADYTGRRLVLAPRSFDRIVYLPPGWQNDNAMRKSHWNSDGFAQLLDATMAPDSVFIADLTQKRDLHWTPMYLKTLIKLSGFDEMLKALSNRIGQLRIHYGYDLGTNTTQSLDYACNSGDSVVHLITGDVWHNLFQLYYNWPISSIAAQWASVLMAVGGLPEPVHVERGMNPLVPAGFKCPYGEIVEVSESRGLQLPSFTTYATVRTE